MDPTTKPMLAELRRVLPVGDYVYEPKWDGLRCLAFVDGDAVDLRSRHQKPLARYFPELVADLRAIARRFVVDGEIVVVGEHGFDFGGARFAATKPFAGAFAGELAARFPEAITDRMAIVERFGRVFIDWGQNDRNKQTVAPYSLRATATPLVSAPLAWDELEAALVTGDAARLRVTPSALFDRLDRVGDLLADAVSLKQSLPG